MKVIKSKKPNHRRGRSNLAEALKNLKPGSDDCLSLATASEFRHFSGMYGLLRSKHKAQFTTKNGPDGTVQVWRVK